MGLTVDGLKLVAQQLVNNTYIDLLDANGVYPPTSGGTYNYASVPCKLESPPEGNDHKTAYFQMTATLDGTGIILSNIDKFYFNDADNGQSSTTGNPSNVWVVSGLAFRGGSATTITTDYLYTGQFATTINIGQFVRPKFAAGAIQITFTSTEVTP